MSRRSSLIFIAASIICGGISAFSPSRLSNFRGDAVLLQLSSSSSENYSSKIDVVTPPSTNNIIATTPSGPYIRIQKRGRHYDVQTAVTTFRKKNTSTSASIVVELHSQIHFGDESYFNYFNDENNFGSLYDKVLYELIVDEQFLQTDATTKNNNMLRTLLPTRDNLNPIAPTAADRNTASQYGLKCQVDGIQYCRENWIHADLTRQEFLTLLSKAEEEEEQGNNRAQTFSNNKQQPQQQQPLWALASTTATYPGSEAFTALLRPLTTTTNSASVQLTRRLFTHLFLPGDALSGWIRAILWFGVPSPELSILLVDWSSLSYIGRGKRRRRRQGGGGGGGDMADDRGVAPISPIAAPVLLSLLTGNWGTARRLVFGQVLVGGQSSEDTSKNSVLIEKRNEHAMNVLRETLRLESDGDDSDSAEQQKRVALLYGAGHCRDLHGRLEKEGYVPVRTEWRTAFRADAPKWGDYFNVDRDFSTKSAEGITSGTSIAAELTQFGEGVISSLSPSALESAAVGLVVLPLYLVIGGMDWVSTLQELGSAFENGQYLDGMAGMILYLVRHVALYVGISKFVIDWGNDTGIVEEEQ